MTFRVGAVLAWTAALDFAHKRELRCQCVPLYHHHYYFMVPWDHQQLYFSKEFHRDCHSTQCVVSWNGLDLWTEPLFYSHWQCSFRLRFLEHSKARYWTAKLLVWIFLSLSLFSFFFFVQKRKEFCSLPIFARSFRNNEKQKYFGLELVWIWKCMEIAFVSNK